jgi:hypothetical protein
MEAVYIKHHHLNVIVEMNSWQWDHGPFKCECQPLLDNKRRCSCCINCLYEEAKLLSKALHLKEIEDTHDRCSNL